MYQYATYSTVLRGAKRALPTPTELVFRKVQDGSLPIAARAAPPEAGHRFSAIAVQQKTEDAEAGKAVAVGRRDEDESKDEEKDEDKLGGGGFAPRGAGAGAVQGSGAMDVPPAQIHRAAEDGVHSASTALPHLLEIQRAFGPAHDLSSIRAHAGERAASASEAMSATAYTRGEHVVFRNAPDLRLAAHEAAHVVQQRSGATADLPGGVGAPGDRFEQAADAVADRVATGRSADDLLPRGAGASPSGLQRKDAGPDKAAPPVTTAQPVKAKRDDAERQFLAWANEALAAQPGSPPQAAAQQAAKALAYLEEMPDDRKILHLAKKRDLERIVAKAKTSTVAPAK